MLSVRMGLASKSQTISFPDLVRVANALTTQIARDVAPIWSRSGTVTALANPDNIDPGIWPIYIVDDLPPGMGGYHQTEHNQPFAMVLAGDTWSLSASHEVLEMLIDPSGNRLVAAPAIAIVDNEIRDADGKFEYLVEVCDPSEDQSCAYLIDDILVSDFYTPNFFDPTGSSGARYSFSGRLTRPRQVLPNGYLSWFNPQNNMLQQVRHFGAPEIVTLAAGRPGQGSITGGRALRGFVDSKTPPPAMLSALHRGDTSVQAREGRAMFLATASVARGGLFAAAFQSAISSARKTVQDQAQSEVPLDEVNTTLNTHLAQLSQPGVIAVRPGWKFGPRGLTADRAIVVTVLPEKMGGLHIPTAFGRVPVDIRAANPFQIMRAQATNAFLMMADARHEIRQPEFPNERFFDGSGNEVPPAGAQAAALTAAARLTKPEINYSGPQGVTLDEVTEDVTLILHASPDAGWDQLSKFLEGVERELVVGMYDFTSAHVLSVVESALAGKKMTLTLDHPAPNPTRDQTDEETRQDLTASVGHGFEAAWALTRSDKFATSWIYPNAYHIKVAVREDDTFWLSSGNWNNSNQPEIDISDLTAAKRIAAKSDRDWHVIAMSKSLAAKFRAYLKHDYDTASAHNVDPAQAAQIQAMPEPELPMIALGTQRQPSDFFKPLSLADNIRIQPLLTPDNYQPLIKALIDSANDRFDMQTQYIHPSGKAGDEQHDDLIAAVVAAIGRGVKVRLITSEYQTDDWVEKLIDAGIPASVIRRQNKVHNKGMLVDNRAVVVSSQNWSADGTLRNRDAGLIIYNAQAVAYFDKIFTHDWDHLASVVKET